MLQTLKLNIKDRKINRAKFGKFDSGSLLTTLEVSSSCF